MRKMLMKTMLGRWMTGAMAGVILSATAAPALGDTIWVRNKDCRIDAYSMYQNLSYYHLHIYISDVYLRAYKDMVKEAHRHKKNPPVYQQLMQYAQMYLQLYYFYNQYAYMFLNWYFYSLIYFYMCEYWRPRHWGQVDD